MKWAAIVCIESNLQIEFEKKAEAETTTATTNNEGKHDRLAPGLEVKTVKCNNSNHWHIHEHLERKISSCLNACVISLPFHISPSFNGVTLQINGKTDNNNRRIDIHTHTFIHSFNGLLFCGKHASTMFTKMPRSLAHENFHLNWTELNWK